MIFSSIQHSVFNSQLPTPIPLGGGAATTENQMRILGFFFHVIDALYYSVVNVQSGDEPL